MPRTVIIDARPMLKVSLASSYRGCYIAMIENDDGSDLRITDHVGEFTSARDACVDAARLLREAADRFDKLALSSGPTKIATHNKINHRAVPDTQLTDGSPVTPDHREINPETGQQKGYVVLSPEERAKGFVRPVRRSYVHTTCGTATTMGQALAETYARDPFFYAGTFCTGCRAHFPVGDDGEFTWDGTDEKVGT